MLGRKILSENISGQADCSKNITDWAKGLYVVKVINTQNNEILFQDKLAVE